MAGSSERIRILKEMLKLDPSSRVFELLAEELGAAGEWEEVEQVCRRGLRFHPGFTRPRVLLGLALMELGDTAESERILIEVQEEMRKNSIVFKVLARNAAYSGDASFAAECSRIYDAFQSKDLQKPAVMPDKTPIEAAALQEPEIEEAPRLDDSLQESAIEESATPETSAAGHAPEEVAPPEPEKKQRSPEQFERILTTLAQRMESKPLPADPALPPLFSRTEKEMLKLSVLAELA